MQHSLREDDSSGVGKVIGTDRSSDRDKDAPVGPTVMPVCGQPGVLVSQDKNVFILELSLIESDFPEFGDEPRFSAVQPIEERLGVGVECVFELWPEV